MMRSWIRFQFVAFGVALMLAIPGTLWADVGLTFAPSDTTVSGGAIVTIQVMVDSGATDLRGFSLAFDYDETIVTLLSVQKGALLAGLPCPSFLTQLNPAVLGTVEVDGSGLGCSMVGPGSIVEVQFLAGSFVTTMVSPLTFNCVDARLRDSLNDPFALNCVDGSITVIPGIPVEGVTWGRVKSLYQ